MRWNGHSTGHYEAWYSTVSQVASGAGFWLRYALVSPRRGPARAEVWFTSFVPALGAANVAVAQRYEIDQFSATAEPFVVRVGPCVLEPARMSGMLEAAGTPVTWDLVWEAVTEPLSPLPEVFYRTSWVRSKFVVPHPFLHIGGKVQIGDHTFICSGDAGQQGHVWGSRHAAEWTWFHCSSFVTEGGEPVPAYVTGITAQQTIAGEWLLPPLHFGHLVWSDKHVALRPASAWNERWQGPWRWSGTAGDEDLTVTLSLPWAEMVLAEYEDPGGRTVYCHHTERADCTVQFRAPRQPPRVFRAAGVAHLELGSRAPDARALRRVLRQR